MPVMLRGIPLLDVRRIVPGVPHFIELGSDDFLDGDLHRFLAFAFSTNKNRAIALKMLLAFGSVTDEFTGTLHGAAKSAATAALLPS
jgi:hypothetical protein